MKKTNNRSAEIDYDEEEKNILRIPHIYYQQNYLQHILILFVGAGGRRHTRYFKVNYQIKTDYFEFVKAPIIVI